MLIYVEHWGEIICNFTPILPHFQHWGDEARQLFFSRKQIKQKPKKRSSPKIEQFLFPKSSEDQTKSPKNIKRYDADHSQIIGRDADADHSQIIGGDAVKLLGGYIPPSGFGTSDCVTSMYSS